MEESPDLKVEMLKTQRGSPDGISCLTYSEGEVVTFSGSPALDLGRVFIREGWAVELRDQVSAIDEAQLESKQDPASAIDEVPMEMKQDRKPPNKQARNPPNKQSGKPSNKGRRRG